MLSKIKQRFQGRHAKNFLTIGFGTTIAQSIPILVAPLLTRLFSPEDFGVFANYMAMLGFLVVVNTGQYQLGIILPKVHKDAVNIAILSFFILIATTIVFVVLFGFLAHPI
ncbi:MAG: hypothetical protein FWC98_01150, partial [Bacteroidales bacterium]|nr:hypothetical protein [Bacteroidales bacterium]